MLEQDDPRKAPVQWAYVRLTLTPAYNKKWLKRYGYVTKFKTYHMDDVHIEQNEGALSFTGQKILGY